MCIICLDETIPDDNMWVRGASTIYITEIVTLILIPVSLNNSRISNSTYSYCKHLSELVKCQMFYIRSRQFRKKLRMTFDLQKSRLIVLALTRLCFVHTVQIALWWMFLSQERNNYFPVMGVSSLSSPQALWNYARWVSSNLLLLG